MHDKCIKQWKMKQHYTTHSYNMACMDDISDILLSKRIYGDKLFNDVSQIPPRPERTVIIKKLSF